MQKIDCRGFTLIELMVTLAIVAIVSAFAIPTLINYQKKFESQQIANQLTTFLVNARSDALIYQNLITLCVADKYDHCVLENGERLVSFIDKNDNQSFDETIDVLRDKIELNPRYGHLVTRVALNKPYVELKPDNGRPIGYMGHIKYCPTDGNTTRMFKVTFSKVGIIKYKDNQEDPTDCNG